MVLYLTRRDKTTLKGPLAVFALFPCGPTGPFSTRQLQRGLNIAYSTLNVADLMSSLVIGCHIYNCWNFNV